MTDRRITRRGFLAGAAAAVAAAGCATGKAPARISTRSPNELINVAAIGAGGKGSSDIRGCRSENIVALCDVDWHRAAGTFEEFPQAARYHDFREMLEKEKGIDAVTISTPDHMHAPAALLAMSMGKHVYVQKPLTHTVEEARMLRLAARKYGVVTQMGNQGHSDEGARHVCEMVWNGDIGEVREAHIWTNRPVWPQGISEPLAEQPVPEFLDWDLFLGVAPQRPFGGYYDRAFAAEGQPPVGYHPFAWRGWWDYGCGALGDMACHIMDAANWALGLGHPTSVEVVSEEGNNPQTGPTASVIRYEFPARTIRYPQWGVEKAMPAVTVYWHDGMKEQPRIEGLDLPEGTKLGDGVNGSLLIGDRGYITAGEYGGSPRLLPDAAMEGYAFPDPVIPRVEFEKDRHYQDWIRGIKGGPAPCSNFEYSGPFTEVVVLGNLALLTGQRMEWDGENIRVTNVPEANRFVRKQYRDGWEMEAFRKDLGV